MNGNSLARSAYFILFYFILSVNAWHFSCRELSCREHWIIPVNGRLIKAVSG